MKKLVVIVIVAFTSNIFCIDAQNLIAVQNSNTPSFYTSLDSAVVHAVNGDTIYIPGGNFALNTNISKRLHIIGVGYHPDSTLVTNPTNINVTSTLNLITGASGGSLMGISLNGNLMFGSNTINISNYIVARCYIPGFVQIGSSISTNNLFYENIISSALLGGKAESNYFYNNVFSANISYIGKSSIFKNNVFLWTSTGYSLFSNTEYSTLENNIFKISASGATFNNGSVYLIVNNNLFVENCSFPYNGCTGSNNIVNQTTTSIFVNQSGTTFSYTQDYHLQPTSQGKNAGRDGTDVGIYGGMYPWKAGSIPSNPHIQTMKIATQTDTNGSLNVNIKVKAQDN